MTQTNLEGQGWTHRSYSLGRGGTILDALP